MDSKAQLTVDITAKVAQGKIDIVNAAKLLGKSRRTIERYLKKYQKIGIQFVIHRNTGRSNHCFGQIRYSRVVSCRQYHDYSLERILPGHCFRCRSPYLQASIHPC